MGLVFLSSGAPRSQFWRISSKVGTKMRKVAYKMGQDSVKMGVLGSTCDVLARSWPQFGRLWEVLGSILEAFWDIGGSVKTNNSTAFWQYFPDLGGSWRVCWKMFCRVGAKTAPRSTFFAQVGDLGGHLGAKMGPTIFQ